MSESPEEAIRLAQKAENAMSYMNLIIETYEKELFSAFADASADSDDDIKSLVVIKHHFDALKQLRDLMNVHIDNGKVAKKQLELANK